MKKTQLRGQLFELRSSSHCLRETEKIAAHLNAFFKDKERTIILALLLLLSGDEKNNELLFALMFLLL